MPSKQTNQLRLSTDPRTAWFLILAFVPLAGWLAWEIHQSIGLNAPRFWQLLRDDRVFDLAMLDFFLTAAWALLVLVEHTRVRDLRFWAALAVFCILPTLGIALFLLFDQRPHAPRQQPPA